DVLAVVAGVRGDLPAPIFGRGCDPDVAHAPGIVDPGDRGAAGHQSLGERRPGDVLDRERRLLGSGGRARPARRGDHDCDCPNVHSESSWLRVGSVRSTFSRRPAWAPFPLFRNPSMTPDAQRTQRPGVLVALLAFVSLVGYALRSNITIAQELMAPELGLTMA